MPGRVILSSPERIIILTHTGVEAVTEEERKSERKEGGAGKTITYVNERNRKEKEIIIITLIIRIKQLSARTRRNCRENRERKEEKR